MCARFLATEAIWQRMRKNYLRRFNGWEKSAAEQQYERILVYKILLGVGFAYEVSFI